MSIPHTYLLIALEVFILLLISLSITKYKFKNDKFKPINELTSKDIFVLSIFTGFLWQSLSCLYFVKQ